MVKVWKARHTKVYIDEAADVTITTAAALDTFFTAAGTEIQANMKNVTITEPEGEVDKIDLLGVDTNGFQNAELDNQPFGLATLTGTLVLDSDEDIDIFAHGSGTTISTTHTRYQVGDGNRPDVAILVNLEDTAELNIAMDNARIARVGDLKISGADGHWERDIKIVCLPKDYYIEFKD